MEQNLLSGVLSLSMVLLNPSGASYAPTNSPIIFEEKRDYAVKEGDTISSIAEKEYGSIEFWTNIWNDNPWIKNPDLIEKDWKLKLQRTKPDIAATLSAELEEKAELNKPEVIIPTTITATQVTYNLQSGNQSTISPAPIAHVIVPASTNYAGGPLNEAQITYLGNCESGMRPTTNTGNSFYGAFQFTIGTWNAMGTGYERADLAPLDVQVSAVQKLLSRSSIYTQFPGCARKMQALGII